jgi:tetratricopeptide (TPR) repeat protein
MLPYPSSYLFNTQNYFMKLICLAAMALLCYSCQRKTVGSVPFNLQTYTDTRGKQMLLGLHKKEDLQQSPYREWFDKNYSDYKIDSITATLLTPLIKNKQFEIFMGTWCGDSRREVPRMYKILEYAGVKPTQIKLLMLDDRDSVYKQSPAHEEKGKSIHRVPDLIVYDHKKEMNRIVEYPVVSLEKDLLLIMKEGSYQPNYKAADYLFQLFKEKNVAAMAGDTVQLTEKLKHMVQNSAELNSLGYVWMAANENDKALMALQLNAALYPNDANVYDSLAEINMKLNKKEDAKKYYRKVLELQPANENAVKMLEQLK